MKHAMLALFILMSPLVSFVKGQAEPREFDYFRKGEIGHPLTVPAWYSVSKFGRGLYRIDSLEESRGQMNCIFLTFTAAAADGAMPATELAWKTERVTADGRALIRLTAVLANPFAREADPAGDVLTIRIDAANEVILKKLRVVVEGLLAK